MVLLKRDNTYKKSTQTHTYSSEYLIIVSSSMPWNPLFVLSNLNVVVAVVAHIFTAYCSLFYWWSCWCWYFFLTSITSNQHKIQRELRKRETETKQKDKLHTICISIQMHIHNSWCDGKNGRYNIWIRAIYLSGTQLYYFHSFSLLLSLVCFCACVCVCLFSFVCHQIPINFDDFIWLLNWMVWPV